LAFNKTAALLVSTLLLSACVADQAVDLESRPIALDQNAEPAGAAGPQGAASVASLLSATGPTYVTMTVAQHEGGVTAASSTRDSTTPITSGSGFVVSSDGYVITAAHVAVAKGNEISARAANGRIYTGVVVALTPENDMALVKLRAFNGRAVVPAAPGCLAPGALLYTLGKPHGGGDTARIGTLQTKHFGRPVSYGKFGYPDALVLHMGTQRGESGGPVFNDKGQLVGMVVSTLSDAAGQSINLAHAIPANTIGKFYCSQGSCAAAWSGIAALPVDGCG
jgi:S1-C subfamily serine protease